MLVFGPDLPNSDSTTGWFISNNLSMELIKYIIQFMETVLVKIQFHLIF